MGAARLLVAMHWSWAELQETPADVVDAVVDELNRQARAAGHVPAPEVGGEW